MVACQEPDDPPWTEVIVCEDEESYPQSRSSCDWHGALGSGIVYDASLTVLPVSLAPSIKAAAANTKISAHLVCCLDHRHRQHHHRIVGRSATVRAARMGKRPLKIRSGCFENHNPTVGFDLIACHLTVEAAHRRGRTLCGLHQITNRRLESD